MKAQRASAGGEDMAWGRAAERRRGLLPATLVAAVGGRTGGDKQAVRGLGDLRGGG
jgi:hypothetical protein